MINMSSKILFWISGALTTFCIANSLQKKTNSNFYAIIDTYDKPKVFFQNQQLVKFQKKWFYHDYFNNLNKPDLEYLSDFEKKYDINLWELVINERIFYRFNETHKFSSDEILSVLERECKLFDEILVEIKPDFLIMFESTLHQHELLYRMCKKIGIKLLIFNQPNISRCIISETPRNFDIKINLDEIPSSNKSFNELREYRKSFDTFNEIKNYKNKFKTSNLQLAKSFLKFIMSKNEHIETHYTHMGRTKFKVLKDELRKKLKRKFRNSFINNNLETEIKSDEKFIYFPLAVDEERNLLIAAPYHTNQVEVLRHISKSLPIGYKLYVKENPAQSIRYWRSISEYRDILNIPNVRLFHPSVPAEILFEKCSLVITIGGSSGFDAAFYEKPSIVFSNLGYSVLPSVQTLNSISNLSETIRKSLQIKVNNNDLEKYLTVLEKNSIKFNLVDFENRYNEFFYYGGYLASVDISESKMEKFLKSTESLLDELISEYLLRIETSKI